MKHGFTLILAGLLACDVPVDADPGEAQGEGPTWHGEIAPLVRARCGACHQDGGIAPFSVERYEDAKPWAAMMAESVRSGSMPPFMAVESDECAPNVWFQGDTRLTADELALLDAWVEAGAPEGDPASAAQIPEPPDVGLTEMDAVLPLPSEFVVPPGERDIYQCFRIEAPNDQDVYLTGIEVLPDNDKVVHHVLVWNDPQDMSAGRAGPDGSYRCSGTPDVWPTELLAAWTPGGSPMRTPEGTGALLKAGASIVVNVHYHPTADSTELDRSSVALEWTTDKPDNFVTWYLVDIPFGAEVQPGPNDVSGPAFHIPAGVEEHVETLVLDTGSYLPWSLPIFAITPHMHYLGTEMLVSLRRDAPGEDECLIHTPGYRFDFQTSYVYDAAVSELPVLMPGDRVEVRCTYNNSLSNPFMKSWLEAAGESEPVDIWWGEETDDEMCMAMVGLIIPPIDLSEYL